VQILEEVMKAFYTAVFDVGWQWRHPLGITALASLAPDSALSENDTYLVRKYPTLKMIGIAYVWKCNVLHLAGPCS
jgi:hypothetical protein